MATTTKLATAVNSADSLRVSLVTPTLTRASTAVRAAVCFPNVDSLGEVVRCLETAMLAGVPVRLRAEINLLASRRPTTTEARNTVRLQAMAELVGHVLLVASVVGASKPFCVTCPKSLIERTISQSPLRLTRQRRPSTPQTVCQGPARDLAQVTAGRLAEFLTQLIVLYTQPCQ